MNEPAGQSAPEHSRDRIDMARKAQARKPPLRKKSGEAAALPVRMPEPAIAPNRRVARDALFVFLAALVVRVLYVLWARGNDPWFTWARPGYDMSVFQAMADMFQSGGKDGWLMRKQGLFYFSPIYGYFCGIVYSIFGNRNFLMLHLIQAIIGAWAVCLAFVTARTWLGRRGAWFAAMCLALAAPWLFYEQCLLHEGLMLFFYCVFLWGVRTASLGWRFKWARLLIAGLVIGLATLGRGNALAVLIAMAAWLGFEAWRGQRLSFARAWAQPAVLVLGTALVLGALVVRNHAVVGKWTVGMENGRVLFYLGNAIDADGTFMYSPRFTEAQTLARGSNDPGAYLRYFREDLAADPGHFFGLLATKTFYFFRTRDLADNMNLHLAEKIILPLTVTPVKWWWLTPLGLVGLGLAWRRWREWLPIWLFAASFAASLILIIPIGRYRAPILLPLAIGAGFAFEWTIAYWKSGRREAVAWAGAGFVVLGLILAPWKSTTDQHFVRPNDYAGGIRAALDSNMPGLAVQICELAMDDYANTQYQPLFLNSRVQTLVAAGEAKSPVALAAANALMQSQQFTGDGALATAEVLAAHGQIQQARDLAALVLRDNPTSTEARTMIEKLR